MAADAPRNTEATKTASEECILVAKARNGAKYEIRCVKADLELASPVLKKMLSEQWLKGNKLEITNFSAEALWLLVEFVSCFELKTWPLHCVDLVELAVAADYFFIRSLVKCCARELRVNVTAADMWTTLDRLIPIKDLDIVAEACERCLETRTDECLDHPSFLKAKSESVVFLLKLNEMHIKDESQLFLKCWEWAKNQEKPLEAMMNVLPKLHLEKDFKCRMERYIQLGPLPADFAAIFVQPILDKLHPFCLNLRKYTLSTWKSSLMNYEFISWRTKLSTEFVTLDCKNPVVSSLTFITKEELHLLELYVPLFYDVEPLLVYNHQGRCHEIAPELKISCKYEVTLVDQYRNLKLCGKVVHTTKPYYKNCPTLDELSLPLPVAHRLLADEPIVISLSMTVDRNCGIQELVDRGRTEPFNYVDEGKFGVKIDSQAYPILGFKVIPDKVLSGYSRI